MFRLLSKFKLPDWSVYGLALGMILFHATRSTEVLAPIAPPELGEALPSIQPLDQKVLVDIDPDVSNGIGTAFSIADNGVWMTARHVVDGCDRLGLMAGGLRAIAVEKVEISQDSDTALLYTKWKRAPLPTDLNSDRHYNEMGYFFGFPQGSPGEVAATLIGRHQLITRGRYDARESVYAWAEVTRTRGLKGSLGGLSGGPVFDSDGEVFGVVSAEAPRRGRIYTVVPSSIVEAAPTKYDRKNGREIDIDSFGTEADRYRRDRRIAQVICLVD